MECGPMPVKGLENEGNWMEYELRRRAYLLRMTVDRLRLREQEIRLMQERTTEASYELWRVQATLKQREAMEVTLRKKINLLEMECEEFKQELEREQKEKDDLVLSLHGKIRELQDEAWQLRSLLRKTEESYRKSRGSEILLRKRLESIEDRQMSLAPIPLKSPRDFYEAEFRASPYKWIMDKLHRIKGVNVWSELSRHPSWMNTGLLLLIALMLTLLLVMTATDRCRHGRPAVFYPARSAQRRRGGGGGGSEAARRMNSSGGLGAGGGGDDAGAGRRPPCRLRGSMERLADIAMRMIDFQLLKGS